MSSGFSKINKEYAGVKVVGSDEVYVYDKKTKKKNKLNKQYDIVGKYDTTFPGVVLKANNKDHRTSFVDDLSSFTSRTKKDMVNMFFDEKGNRNKRRVAYLVRTDRKSKTSDDVKKILK